MKKKDGAISFPYRMFHKFTEIGTFSSPRIRLSASLLKRLNKISHKEYPGVRSYPLSPDNLPNIPLQNSLLLRSSRRAFSETPLSIQTLSSLLYYSAGVKNDKEKRFYPSAGARYPLETYVCSLNTELPKGLYHYNLRGNRLELIGSKKTPFPASLLNQEWIQSAGCVIFVTAVFERTTMKYRDRGYRYMLMESGHLMQNFSLVSSALNLGGCIIGGFVDGQINAFLGIDGKNESVLCMYAAGHILTE